MLGVDGLGGIVDSVGELLGDVVIGSGDWLRRLVDDDSSVLFGSDIWGAADDWYGGERSRAVASAVRDRVCDDGAKGGRP